MSLITRCDTQVIDDGTSDGNQTQQEQRQNTVGSHRLDGEWSQQLVEQMGDLRRFGASLCKRHEDIDDLVQETLTRAWICHHQFRAGSNLGAWLFTIMRNCFLSQLRRRRREVEDVEERFAMALSDPPAQATRLHQQDVIRTLLKLPAAQRDALLLVAVHDFTYQSAAELCGCPIGTIKSRITRARERLVAEHGIGSKADGVNPTL